MSISRYVNEGFQGVNYIMWTDKESSNNSNPVDLDLDQETTMNACQVENSSMYPDKLCVIHLDISPAVNNQNDIANSTSDDSSINVTRDNSNVVFSTGSSESILSHQRSNKSISENKSAEGTSLSKEVSKSKKVKQYRSTSIALTKSHALCCKLSIVFAICCTTGLSLMPIIFFYVSQIVNDDVPTGPEYSHERNTSTAAVSYN